MKENEWDKLLKIRTTGRDDSHADTYRYPYEPTDYEVLELLANEGLIGKKNTLLDYGCGKGRVEFFLSYQVKCHSIGIEYDDRIYDMAIRNKESAVSGNRVEFILGDAKEYTVPKEVDRIFFFNPFSAEILMSVIENIVDSFYDNPREILLFFYYPSDEYIACLMKENRISFVDEIDCRECMGKDDIRERIMIFEVLYFA